MEFTTRIGNLQKHGSHWLTCTRTYSYWSTIDPALVTLMYPTALRADSWVTPYGRKKGDFPSAPSHELLPKHLRFSILHWWNPQLQLTTSTANMKHGQHMKHNMNNINGSQMLTNVDKCWQPWHLWNSKSLAPKPSLALDEFHAVRCKHLHVPSSCQTGPGYDGMIWNDMEWCGMIWNDMEWYGIMQVNPLHIRIHQTYRYNLYS